MSHIATIQTEIRDLDALKSACAELGAQFIEIGHLWVAEIPSGEEMIDWRRFASKLRRSGWLRLCLDKKPSVVDSGLNDDGSDCVG
jgi:hypothetical protein